MYLRVYVQLATKKRNELISAHNDLLKKFDYEESLIDQVDRLVMHVLLTNSIRCYEQHIYNYFA